MLILSMSNDKEVAKRTQAFRDGSIPDGKKYRYPAENRQPSTLLVEEYE